MLIIIQIIMENVKDKIINTKEEINNNNNNFDSAGTACCDSRILYDNQL